jgi:biofilm PGA synthesis N-glycosyltransferase PgaC
MNGNVKYVVITPARDEAAYIEATIQSVASQTVRPSEWLIIDDGSSDGTSEIVQKYASRLFFLRLIHRENRGFRQSGAGVIEAFYDGLQSMSSNDWDFIVKLDADLRFGEDYFDRCFKNFLSNKRLGIGGGTIYNLLNGELKLERTPAFHVRGATKIYRRGCWEAIQGLVRAPGWDTVDEVKANMLGWETRTFPEIKIIQLKPTGSADGFHRDLIKGGQAAYFSGYHPLFMIMRCLGRAIRKPFLLGSFCLMYGYVSSYLKKSPRTDDKALIRYLRKQQLRKLSFRKNIWK